MRSNMAVRLMLVVVSVSIVLSCCGWVCLISGWRVCFLVILVDWRRREREESEWSGWSVSGLLSGTIKLYTRGLWFFAETLPVRPMKH